MSILAFQGSECVTCQTQKALVPKNPWDTPQKYMNTFLRGIICFYSLLSLSFLKIKKVPNKTFKGLSSGQCLKMCISKQNKRGASESDLSLKVRTQTPKLEDFKNKESFFPPIFMIFNFSLLLLLCV